MQLSQESLNVLCKIVCGDLGYTPIMTEYGLVELFNRIGFEDSYVEFDIFVGDSGFSGPGLWSYMDKNEYTLNRLQILNECEAVGELLEQILDDRHYESDPKFLTKLPGIIDYVATHINRIIKHDGYSYEKVTDTYKLKGPGIGSSPISVEAYFEDIRNKVIEQIRLAKYIIWIAVAWFTDKMLFDELIKKKEEGVNIQLVIADVDENNKLLLAKNFLTIRVKKGTCYGKKIESLDSANAYEDLMHNKFCIIDLKTVIHGSYNWTAKAEHNDESITIINSREQAEKFADKFIDLKIQSKKSV